MYVSPNFKTKKALVEAVFAGKTVSVYSPGPWPCPQDGIIAVEGPHYPEPHRWYAEVEVKSGQVVKVIGAKHPKPKTTLRQDLDKLEFAEITIPPNQGYLLQGVSDQEQKDRDRQFTKSAQDYLRKLGIF